MGRGSREDYWTVIVIIMLSISDTFSQRKKHSANTARCSKMDPKKFAPPQTPFPGVRDGQNLISWRWSLPLSTDSVWWGSMHAISSYRGNRPTHTHTHTHPATNRQDLLQCTVLQLACSVKKYRCHYCLPVADCAQDKNTLKPVMFCCL